MKAILLTLVTLSAGCDHLSREPAAGDDVLMVEQSPFVADFANVVGASDREVAKRLIGSVDRCRPYSSPVTVLLKTRRVDASTVDKAENGEVAAQNALGHAYFAGAKGIEKDADQAIYWFERAAQQDPDAAFMVGAIEIERALMARTPISDRAWRRVSESARTGNRKAMRCFAAMIAHSDSSDEALRDSLVLVSDAELNEFLIPTDESPIDKGLDDADYQLGALFVRGKVTEPDLVRAARHMERAAKKGRTVPMGILGLMYANGNGVAQSDQQAYYWLLMAAKFDAKFNRARDAISEKLSPQERANAQHVMQGQR